MTVDGSSTTVNFDFAPAAGQFVLLEYVTLFLRDDGAMEPNVFGSLAIALANGLCLSAQSNGTAIASITEIVDNADVMQCFGGIVGQVGPGLAGFFNSEDWIAGVYTMGHTLELDGDQGDFIRFEVRDDLTGIDFLQASCRFRTIIS